MLRAFLSSFSIIMIGVACAFLTHLILAKILPASEYGIFSFVYSISLLLSVFSLFGFQNSVVRLIPSYEGQVNQIKKLVGFSRKFTVLLSVVSGFLCFAILNLFGFDEIYSLEALVLSVILIPLMVLMRLHASFLRGFQKSVFSVLYETSLREILLLLFVVGSLIFGVHLESGFDALVLLVLSLVVVTIISLFHTQKFLSGGDLKKSEISESKEWIKISLPMMLTLFIQRLLRRADIIILGLMTSPVLVGAYAIAAQFSDVSSIGQKGIFAIFSARAASLYQANSKAELKALYQKMQLYGILTTGMMSAVIAVLAPFVLAYFGADYIEGYNALLILLVGQFLNVSFGPVGVLMIMTEYEKVSMKLTMMAAMGNILFNPLAIYLYGLEGAAVVTVFFLVLRAALSYIFVKRQQLI